MGRCRTGNAYADCAPEAPLTVLLLVAAAHGYHSSPTQRSQGTLQWKRRSTRTSTVLVCCAGCIRGIRALVIMIVSGVKGFWARPSLRVRTSRAKKKKKMQVLETLAAKRKGRSVLCCTLPFLPSFRHLYRVISPPQPHLNTIRGSPLPKLVSHHHCP